VEENKTGRGALEITPSCRVLTSFDQRDPDRGKFQGGLADRVVHARHVGRFFVFSVSTLAFNV
jgi:hypothetical protein